VKNNKYLIYQDEILYLFNKGNNYNEISRHLIEKYCLDVSVDYLRKQTKVIVQWLISDKEIVQYNVKLSKQKQKAQDLNRIANKSFREYAREENALVEYNKELVKVLKENSLDVKLTKHKRKKGSVVLVQIADTHFNELVDMESNQYDFKIASKRLQKFAYYVMEYAKLHNASSFLIGITGDLINSDRRLDEKLSMATNRAKATFLGVHLLKHFILDLQRFADVKVCCVTGNESRVNQELGWVDLCASDNYDFTIFEMLRLLLPEIEFLRGDNALEMVVEINGNNVLVIHGHQLGKMDSNQVGKVVSKYAHKGIIIDFIICGHLHETMIRDSIARSASLVGSNAYSEKALNLSGKAAQNIYIFTNDGRQDVRIDLQETDGWDGYNIDEELFSYNTKSLQKTYKKDTIFKIII
jgi:predicted MPP superfamily phosphohydrolase